MSIKGMLEVVELKAGSLSEQIEEQQSRASKVLEWLGVIEDLGPVNTIKSKTAGYLVDAIKAQNRRELIQCLKRAIIELEAENDW